MFEQKHGAKVSLSFCSNEEIMFGVLDIMRCIWLVNLVLFGSWLFEARPVCQ